MLKNIIKIAAIVILTGGIVAISVMKSSISAKRQTVEIEKMKERFYTYRDSVFLQQLNDSTRHYVDSILKVEIYYGHQLDSLNNYYDSLLKAQQAAQAKQQTATKPAQTTRKTVKKPPAKDPTVEAIKYNYRRMLKGLPTDLTPYEKRVSVKEIVITLSRQFKVSPDSVNKIVN